MRTIHMSDPVPAPDDEITQAARDPWWAPIATRLLDQLDAPPAIDDDPAPAPGR